MEREALKHKAASCWERYASSEERAEMDALAAEFLDFLTQCKTERETIAWVVEQAGACGFSDDLRQDLVMLPFRSKAVLLARRGTKPLARACA
jgi:hypothetical protein